MVNLLLGLFFAMSIFCFSVGVYQILRIEMDSKKQQSFWVSRSVETFLVPNSVNGIEFVQVNNMADLSKKYVLVVYYYTEERNEESNVITQNHKWKKHRITAYSEHEARRKILNKYLESDKLVKYLECDIK
jgi:hypothetical protein